MTLLNTVVPASTSSFHTMAPKCPVPTLYSWFENFVVILKYERSGMVDAIGPGTLA